MDTIELAEKFLELEKKYNLVEKENAEGIQYWAAVRRKIYTEILSAKKFFPTIEVKKVSKFNSFLNKFFLICDIIISEIILFFRKKKAKTLFIDTSRFIDDNGNPIDFNLNSYYKYFENDCYHIECYVTGKWNFKQKYIDRYFIHRIAIYNFMANRIKPKGTYKEEEALINTYFDLNINWDSFITKHLYIFEKEYSLSKKVIEKFSPRYIFIAGYLREPLIAASKSYGDDKICTIEVQHGSITPSSILYRFPENIQPAKIQVAPDYYFIHSENWHNYLGEQKSIIVGSEFFYREKIDYFKSDDIVIVSGIFTYNILRVFVNELAVCFPDINIFFKLHSSEQNRIQETKNYFQDHSNVSVIFNEISITNLFKKSKFVILNQSSCAYEAVQMGLQLIILKELYYKESSDLFTLPNVFLADNYLQVEKHIKTNLPLKAPKNFNHPQYFIPFQNKTFQDFLEHEK